MCKIDGSAASGQSLERNRLGFMLNSRSGYESFKNGDQGKQEELRP
jgi:hypothetical protein